MKVLRDHKSRDDQCGDLGDVRITEEQKLRVRRLCSANAQDSKGRTDLIESNYQEMVDDAALLMMALGVHPSQDNEPDFLVGPPQSPNSRGGSQVS